MTIEWYFFGIQWYVGGSVVVLHLIVVDVSSAYGGADTHFYGQFWARLRPKLSKADAFLPVLWRRWAVEESSTV
ncbi:MAG: hypothetical protein Fur0021_33070 [Candidatus Promineifilaceae bacterium]